MRLHHIVISTVVAALVSGCGNQKPDEPAKNVVASTTTATATTTGKDDGSIESLLPGEDVEKLLFRREKSKEIEDQQDDERDKRMEHKLIKTIRASQKKQDIEGTVRGEIELGKFLRTNRRYHDAVEAYQRAVNVSSSLPSNSALAVEAQIQLGEGFLRLNNFPEALGMFEQAGKSTLPANNEFNETPARIQVRKAWVLHCMGRTAEADEQLNKALKAGAKGSSAYRIALLEQGVMALDQGDKEQVAAINKEIAALPPVPIKEASFGKVFIRVCARNCRKKGQLEQEDYLEEHSEYWANAEKAAAKAIRERNPEY